MDPITAAEVHPGSVVNTYDLGFRTVTSVTKIPGDLIRLDYTFGPQEYYRDDESVDVQPLAS